ncbi:MAG: AEC family transporter [Sterolibacteriaceae bacterium]|uniref:AEC family transporter n=1 Tax=Candidatus Methylophosphatis roskildensis TaxID=2899263 RepID=A0A9D7HJI5_9PROT|nr:AEC family transporter [Candidatus Methylophosphatis roskildensis]MBK7235019.1 AEC family transporter [Sterolibacteriaceae bacterium]
MTAALLLLPDFSLILLGSLLRRWLGLGDHFWRDLEKLIYVVLFPALLFGTLARTRIDFAAAAPLVATGLAVLLTGALFGLAARPLFRQAPLAFASQFQCAFRYNSYIGLAVAAKLNGAEGLAAMGILVGTMVPVANLLAVGMLARHGETGLLRELARNPLIFATLSGLTFNAAGFTLPAMPMQLLSRLGEASIALGLLSVGAALKLRGKGGAQGAAIYFTAVKLLALPSLAWWLGRALGLGGVYYQSAVLFAALPTATSAYILAVRMGGDGPGVAWLVTVSTMTAMLTLPVWLTLL